MGPVTHSGFNFKIVHEAIDSGQSAPQASIGAEAIQKRLIQIGYSGAVISSRQNDFMPSFIRLATNREKSTVCGVKEQVRREF